MVAKLGTGDHKDFDETRRLLYMALLAPRTKRYNLAGTLVNALAHHHAVDDLSVMEIIDNVLAVIDGDPDTVMTSAPAQWVKSQIDRINAETHPSSG